jgi:hypothetical protein
VPFLVLLLKGRDSEYCGRVWYRKRRKFWIILARKANQTFLIGLQVHQGPLDVRRGPQRDHEGAQPHGNRPPTSLPPRKVQASIVGPSSATEVSSAFGHAGAPYTRAILDQNAGRPVTMAEAARFFGGTASGEFQLETSSSKKYGFLASDNGKLVLTDRAKRALRPQRESDELSAIREAVLDAPEISDVYNFYRGEYIPDQEFFFGSTHSPSTLKCPRISSLISGRLPPAELASPQGSMIPSGRCPGDRLGADSHACRAASCPRALRSLRSGSAYHLTIPVASAPVTGDDEAGQSKIAGPLAGH